MLCVYSSVFTGVKVSLQDSLMVFYDLSENGTDGSHACVIAILFSWRSIVENNCTSHRDLIGEKIGLYTTFTRLSWAKRIVIIQLPCMKHLDESFYILLWTDIMRCSPGSKTSAFGVGSDPRKPHLIWACQRFFFSVLHHRKCFYLNMGSVCSVCSATAVVRLVLESSANECVCFMFFTLSCKSYNWKSTEHQAATVGKLEKLKQLFSPTIGLISSRRCVIRCDVLCNKRITSVFILRYCQFFCVESHTLYGEIFPHLNDTLHFSAEHWCRLNICMKATQTNMEGAEYKVMQNRRTLTSC